MTRYDDAKMDPSTGLAKHPLAGVPQEALDAATEALREAVLYEDADTVATQLDGDVESVAHAVLMAALAEMRPTEPTTRQFLAALAAWDAVVADLNVDWTAREPVQGEATPKVFAFRMAKATLEADSLPDCVGCYRPMPEATCKRPHCPTRYWDPPDALVIHDAAGPCEPRYHRALPGGGRCRCGELTSN